MPTAAPRNESGQPAAAAKPDRKTTLLLWGVLLSIAALLFGWLFFARYFHARAHDEQFREKYHLTKEQLARVRTLEEEHQARYRALAERAEAIARDLEMRLYPGVEPNAEVRDIMAQAQREREACWEEEISHHRRVSEVMSPEDGRRYLAGWQARYDARRNGPNGLLLLPHR